MFRWLVYGLLACLLGLVVLPLLVAWLLLARLDIAHVAARIGSSTLGRTVTIGSLHLTPGRWMTIDVKDFDLANIATGSRPAMIEVGRLHAELDTLSLLRRPVVVRQLQVEGLSILLERTADRTANWRLGGAKEKSPPSNGRRQFPTLLDALVTNSDVIYRSSSGSTIRVTLDRVRIRTDAADSPVHMAVTGAYNGKPVALQADLQSIAALRNEAVPYGMVLHLTSGGVALDFSGTATDPLNVDGMHGKLEISAASVRSIGTLAGSASSLDAPVRLAGDFERAGDRWQLNKASGTLQDSAFSAPLIRLVEGAGGKPDDFTIDLGFDRLDLDRLLGKPAPRGRRTSGNSLDPGGAKADIVLDIVRHPDPLVHCHLSARDLTYSGLRGTDASIDASSLPGHIDLKELSLIYLGAHIRAAGRLDAADQGARLSGDIDVSGADVQQVRQLLGLKQLPLFGKLAARLTMNSSGLTLNQASRAATVAAAISMTGGSIDRHVIEMASTDVRALVRKAKGTTPVSCLLGVATMRAGNGAVAPLQISTGIGTIIGNARFDLQAGSFDLTFGTRSRSTNFFALDIPIRIYGSFANPTVRPARWTAAGRAAFAAANTPGPVPDSLRPLIERNTCR